MRFLCGDSPDGLRGRRVELNALIGRTFIAWLEAKLEETGGVAKVVPAGDVLETAYRRAIQRRLLNEAMADAADGAAQRAAGISVPANLASLVTDALHDHRGDAWDDVIAWLARDRDLGV